MFRTEETRSIIVADGSEEGEWLEIICLGRIIQGVEPLGLYWKNRIKQLRIYVRLCIIILWGRLRRGEKNETCREYVKMGRT